MRHIGTRELQTERLILRRFNANDCEDMFQNWASDPDVQSEYGEPSFDTLSAVKALLEKYIAGYRNPEFYRWAIVEKASDKNIGQIAFCRVYSDCRTAEIEYCIGKNWWGNAYAGEALAAVIDYTFEHTDFAKLEAYHRCENLKSGRVLEKSRMRKTDSVERFVREKIAPHGEICYCISAKEYRIF